jgi:hypothetical protein
VCVCGCVCDGGCWLAARTAGAGARVRRGGAAVRRCGGWLAAGGRGWLKLRAQQSQPKNKSAMFVWLIDMERLTFKIRKVVVY